MTGEIYFTTLPFHFRLISGTLGFFSIVKEDLKSVFFLIKKGKELAGAAQQIADTMALARCDIRVRDADWRCEDPRGGITAFEWLEDDTEQLFENKRLWVQPHLRGG